MNDVLKEKITFTKGYKEECKSFIDYLSQLRLFPVNADDDVLIKEFEKINMITINIFALNQEAYSVDCQKKLHELWNARYITETPARYIKREHHMDLMIIRKHNGYTFDKKINANTPIYLSHYVMLVDAIELATYR